MGAVRLAVVGTKGIGRKHIEAINAVPGCELVAICDVDADEAKACGGEFSVPCYVELDQMLAKEHLDAIAIATPHWYHPSIAIKAFGAGLNVLTEKPMAVTVEDAEKMIEASHKHSKMLAVVFQQRAVPMNIKARELIESGAIGEIQRTLLVAPWFRTNAYYSSGSWRGTWKGEGGGVLLNQAPHSLDLFLWISGIRPSRLYGKAETVQHRIEVEDRATALLEYENGATGYLYASTVEAPDNVRMEFAGDKGRLLLGDKIELCRLEVSSKEYNETTDEIWGSPKAAWETIEVPVPDRLRQGHEAVYEDFADAVSNGRRPMVTGEEGLRSLELANAITLSSQRNESVDIPIPRKAYSELVALLAGRASRRRRRGTAKTKRM